MSNPDLGPISVAVYAIVATIILCGLGLGLLLLKMAPALA